MITVIGIPRNFYSSSCRAESLCIFSLNLAHALQLTFFCGRKRITILDAVSARDHPLRTSSISSRFLSISPVHFRNSFALLCYIFMSVRLLRFTQHLHCDDHLPLSCQFCAIQLVRPSYHHCSFRI
ncbi:hypothetical protein FRC14_000967 [Serendipita sp. 396]|nr:hypothetical protein FRC14_000967 [Serendipita sp. 396]